MVVGVDDFGREMKLEKDHPSINEMHPTTKLLLIKNRKDLETGIKQMKDHPLYSKS